MTTSPYDTYTSPLATRNASPAMLRLWSARHKFNTWRKIWLAVAEAQHEVTATPPTEVGGSERHAPLVTREQVEELRAVVNRPGGITDEEMRAAEKYERELRHDVMAHVHALGDSCPKAKGIIHLGMTSQDVVCNADCATIWDARALLLVKLAELVSRLSVFADRWRGVPALGFTHYQPGQPVTVGRRAAQWASELFVVHQRMLTSASVLVTRGLRGATGSAASYLELLGSGARADQVEALFVRALLPADQRAVWQDVGRDPSGDLAQAAGFMAQALVAAKAKGLDPSMFERKLAIVRAKTPSQFSHVIASELLATHTFNLQGQTYPRVIDTFILADVASVAAVLHKIATDIRLLCNRKELDEPFEDTQIGSSAMPYKRNPMRCERICGLTRFVMNLVGNAYDTAATQWLERTLDDSSNRRLSLPEAFLALDGALDLMNNVASGLVVHEAMVRKNLMAELPFLATENILMACVKLGGDRQEYHEHIRKHAQAAGLRVKQEGHDNDLLDRLKADKNFWSKARGGPLASDLDWQGVLDPMRYIGRSVEQTERFIKDVVEPLRTQYADAIAALDNGGPKV